ncbi:NAD(P)/FAD-dependent oxidoreductase [Ferruginibacter sp. HRS2-29]|uniref:NAD(P)/FAD-dependent oxidoreductase n=1 Tax=Ferruginibacter sp. HRS2-29 TaxID=2487334 RepID=UPI0020CD8468|nr:FAD-dependent monooxygenase [Ferruginibacter sp. HRS2-29]MCP9751797.1 FAD-binding protein [Ferruginibacter sp. HRS2-29]
MQQKISLKLSPAEAADDAVIKKKIAKSAAKKETDIYGFTPLKKSIDARGKTVYINLTVNAFIGEPSQPVNGKQFTFQNVTDASKKVVIIGAGPTGLFAALQLLGYGIKPILLERGKDVRSRRRDLAILNKEGIVNSESNYCFGEGGAGTYSDGKLYTRSSKRGDIDRILQLFVQFGAPDNILYDAHPHIGTNKLPHIITAMRKVITDHGGEFLFEKKVTDLVVEKGTIKEVLTADGDRFSGDAYILATGHSARDIFELLHSKGILIEAKPFALGVRIEHPQQLIDGIQYHATDRDEHLPPASYSLVQQVEGRGVFSFCMCPGGIIAPAATSPGELVVNGWSPSKRNNPFANSGMVVQVEQRDALEYLNGSKVQGFKGSKGSSDTKVSADDPLLFLKFQQMVEQAAFEAGGGNFVAPAQRMQDFINRKVSASLPKNSYLPGLKSADLTTVLPSFIYDTLVGGFKAFGKKLRGYLTNEAVVVATESRTSSPVRIPRNEALEHPQISNLYPSGEGAGYAGGIVSAAMDGERVAKVIVEKIGSRIKID